MLKPLCFALSLLLPQGAPQGPGADPVPTLAEVRKGMGIPSQGQLRGQQDAVGFASTAAQMAEVWRMAEQGPAPETFGQSLSTSAIGAIMPHDDYLYAGRVYRRMAPLIRARTVVLVGVFHKYRRFGVRDHLVFEDYRAWRSPDGDIQVSALRDTLLASLGPEDATRNPAMHDSEHSLEAIAYWLKHQRPDLEILPILVPAMSFPRMKVLSEQLGQALAGAMRARGMSLGQDLAIVISSDGVHYGSDFRHTPYGEGGVTAFTQAMARDRALLQGPLAGPVSPEKALDFFSACVDPTAPDNYRLPWCGRFSVPFGLLLMASTTRALGLPAPKGIPAAFGASVDTPELPVKALGLGATAPANLYHFVSYPGVTFVAP